MTPPIDLRSDTVTRPTPAMRKAMAEAEVGDDFYGEDPTVNRLQEEAARRLGFEAALFVPSGTMGNEIAIRLLTEPGQEVLAEERTHVVQYELSAMAVLSGVVPHVVAVEDGGLRPHHVRLALKPPALNRAPVGLVVLENTHNLAGGVVYSAREMADTIAASREAGLRVHIDGARVWNAAVAEGVEPGELLKGADTAMVTLSKGLGAPAGSLLLCSGALYPRARQVRQLLGGGMRQAGILAAAGLVGLNTMVSRLAEDHENAQILARALARCPGVRVTPARTNIVVGRLEEARAPAVAAALAARGVRASAMDAYTLRLVTHYDVSRADCERAADALVAALA